MSSVSYPRKTVHFSFLILFSLCFGFASSLSSQFAEVTTRFEAPARIAIRVIPQGPELADNLTVTSKVGRAFQYQIPASGQNLTYLAPDLRFPWWDGFKLDPKTGMLTAASPGTMNQNLRITISNELAVVSTWLNVVIVPNTDPPQIISSQSATGQVGVGFIYQIIAENLPQEYLAANLPPGLVFYESSGVINGTALTSGRFTVQIGATNQFGATWTNLALRINQSTSPPSLFNLAPASAQVGLPFNRAVSCANEPLRFSAVNLPTGLQIAEFTGVISGTPLVGGVYQPTLTAYNGYGRSSGDLIINVTSPPGAPVISSPSSLNGTVGKDFSYQIITSPAATSFAIQGQPPGLTVHPQTGLISGKPEVTGYFSVAIMTENSAGKSGLVANMIVGIAPNTAYITSSLSQTGMLGDDFLYPITTTGGTPTFFRCTNLPPQLQLNAQTGVISGRFVGSGSYWLNLEVGSASGTYRDILRLEVGRDYAGWCKLYTWNASQSAPTADPDGDGIINLGEYAFNANPLDKNAHIGPKLVPQEGGYYLVFSGFADGQGNVLSDYAAGGIHYRLETAPGLNQPWISDINQFGVHVRYTPNGDGTQILEIPVYIEPANTSRFFRVRIE